MFNLLCFKIQCTYIHIAAITVAVFLVEKTGRLLTLEDGKSTTAGTINKLMAENLSLEPSSAKVFCLWLMSPLLRKLNKENNVCCISLLLKLTGYFKIIVSCGNYASCCTYFRLFGAGIIIIIIIYY